MHQDTPPVYDVFNYKKFEYKTADTCMRIRPKVLDFLCSQILYSERFQQIPWNSIESGGDSPTPLRKNIFLCINCVFPCFSLDWTRTVFLPCDVIFSPWLRPQQCVVQCRSLFLHRRPGVMCGRYVPWPRRGRLRDGTSEAWLRRWPFASRIPWTPWKYVIFRLCVLKTDHEMISSFERKPRESPVSIKMTIIPLYQSINR